MEIVIKNTNGLSVIVFNQFKKESTSPPIFINCLVQVNANGFNAKQKINLELSDFEEMLENLMILNKTLKRIFYFQHIDEQLTIKFEPIDTGHILITGSLRNIDNSGDLDFRFESDQSQLPSLINDCRKVIERFSSNMSIDKFL